MQWLVFSVDQQRLGFHLSYIVRVISAVEITPLPNAPCDVEGMINIHGEIVPVINLRRLLGMRERPLELDDQFIICQIDGKSITLWVDQVSGLKEYAEKDLIPAKTIFSRYRKCRLRRQRK